MIRGARHGLLACVLAIGAASLPARADTVMLSTQLRPIESAEAFRNEILKGSPEKVEFVTDDPGPFVARVKGQLEAGQVTVGLIGAQHGELAPLASSFEPVDDIIRKLGRKFSPDALELAKLGTDKALYVPWMQATFIMVANKKALAHLPQGVDVNALTYDQLAQWGEAIQAATGERKLGFPGGPKGLLYRFFQGYLYPAYTGGVVRPFKSPEAVAMWESFRSMWKGVNPRSTTYDFMEDPLLAEEVWVAFDHTARVMGALRAKPDDFVAFPAPRGPKGLGYMPVLAGLAIPKGGPNREGAEKVIDYLTQPAAQATTVRALAFYPVVEGDLPADLGPGVAMASEAVLRQANAEGAITALLPVGLGEKTGEFNKIFTDTFQRIVVRGQDAQKSLATEAEKLATIMGESGAACWAPDPRSDGPCPVE